MNWSKKVCNEMGVYEHQFAVIGHPVSHSLSPLIHQHFARQFGIALHYARIEGEVAIFEQQVKDFFAQGGKGLNVTLPFKQRAWAVAVNATSRAHQANAANTLWVENGQIQADNTDGLGLVRDLRRYASIKHRKILILGAGGAARGIIGPLLEEQPEQLVIANRTEEKAQALLKDFPGINVVSLDNLPSSFDLIINATSASMTKGNMVLPAAVFSSKPFCYDLAYHATRATAFVSLARSFGCQAVDGLGMLVEQAAFAFELWHNVHPDVLSVLTIFQRGKP